MSPSVNVRFFGLLHTLRVGRDLPTEERVPVPPEGIVAEDLARQLELPVDRIEAVFRNHVVHGLDCLLRPGDEVAFVPRGTPGPHRYALGIYRAGAGTGR